MRTFSLSALLATTPLSSCGGPKPPAVDTVYEEFHMEGTVDKTVAEMSVEGMMCEVGRVAKVRKELLEVRGCVGHHRF